MPLFPGDEMSYPTDLNTFAERLRWARGRKGWTQAELAAAAGVSVDVIKQIEIGRTQQPKQILSISGAIGVSAAWLQFGVPEIEQLDREAIEAALQLQSLPDAQRKAMSESIRLMAEAHNKERNDNDENGENKSAS